MMSWWGWAASLVGCVAACVACSGKSDRNSGDPIENGDGTSMGGAGGTSQGAAGDDGAASTDTSSGAQSSQVSTGSVTTTTGARATSSTSSGTSSSGPRIPEAWTCSVFNYADGTCDCGCGAPDYDCPGGDVDACVRCSGPGSCGTVDCPGTIDPTDTTQCMGPPRDWTCPASAYGDGGVCHCGCGAFDPDCEDSTSDSCDTCVFNGSCAGKACPSTIDDDDNSRCVVPEGWICPPNTYADGACHCGCGIIDVDCSGTKRIYCERCQGGCSEAVCPGFIDDENNALCTTVPADWTCDARFYGDGQLCHCGCGVFDPDCSANDVEACDRCDFEGSCSARECPNTIDSNDIGRCTQPAPPEGWICPDGDYADGSVCHCGCGAVDLDCPDQSADSCESCSECSFGCPGRIDPDNSALCLPPPDDWICEDRRYNDDGGYCDCGCGVLDPDCESLDVTNCDYCPIEYGSCAEDIYCTGLVPDDNTRCVDSAPPEWACAPDAYGDEACDCGCGVRDLDCPSGDPSDCEFCDLEGSCSEADCSELDADDNSVCEP